MVAGWRARKVVGISDGNKACPGVFYPMPDDDKRSEDTLEEIRDLLVEIRDIEKKSSEESRRICEDVIRRQKRLTRVTVIMMAPIMLYALYLMWVLLRKM